MDKMSIIRRKTDTYNSFTLEQLIYFECDPGLVEERKIIRKKNVVNIKERKKEGEGGKVR